MLMRFRKRVIKIISQVSHLSLSVNYKYTHVLFSLHSSSILVLYHKTLGY